MSLDQLIQTPAFAIGFTILIYMFFMKVSGLIKNSYIRPLVNPILFTAMTILTFYGVFGFDLNVYRENIKIIPFFLPIATILMAVNVYRNRHILKQYFWVIFISVGIGSFVSLVIVPLLAIHVFSLNDIFMVPGYLKSITSAFGLEIAAGARPGSESLTLFAIVITGISGAVFLPVILKIFKIEKELIAWGIATGTSSHLVGTSKALEINQQAAGISSVSLALAGLWVLFLFSFFSWL